MSQPSAPSGRKVFSHTRQGPLSYDVLLHVVTGREAPRPWLGGVSTAGFSGTALKKGVNIPVCQENLRGA